MFPVPKTTSFFYLVSVVWKCILAVATEVAQIFDLMWKRNASYKLPGLNLFQLEQRNSQLFEVTLHVLPYDHFYNNTAY